VPAKKETMTIAHESQHRFFFYAGKISFYFPFYLIFFSLAESRNENTETQTLLRFNCCGRRREDNDNGGRERNTNGG
jgi:hypothetical protein